MKICEPKMYRNIIYKNGFKVKMDINILIYNKIDELYIVTYLLKYTSNFFVLLANSIDNITLDIIGLPYKY